MRVPPPGLLKLDRLALLADVRARIAEVLPQYAQGEEDPTDPGWLLLEQAAWLAEVLSEQLDQYPFAAVQHFVHMMGGRLRPAHPAVGVLLADVSKDGVLELDPRRPSPWRFFTPQDEEMDTIEFVPAESGVELRRASLRSMCEISGDELYLTGPTATTEGLAGAEMWRGSRRRSRVFAREELWFDAVTNNPDGLKEALDNALKLLAERRIGWLRFRVEEVARERIRLVAVIDPAGAFERTAPGGLWIGGDLEGDWGMLDGTTWTPVVTIRRHSMLPSHLHDQFPLPGFEEGQILLTDIPENFPVAELLERKASPTPEVVIEAIWETLANLDARLAPIRPLTQVNFLPGPEEDDLEPTWVAAALSSGGWSQLVRSQPRTIFHVHLAEQAAQKGRLRVGMLFEVPHTVKIPQPDAIGINAEGGVERTKISVQEVWRLPAPPRERTHLMPTLVAYDVQLVPGMTGVLLSVSGEPVAGMLNPLLIVNAPAVSDGRSLTITRNVPTEYSLLFEDVVDRSVIDQLLEEAVPKGAGDRLRKLPLSYFTVADQEPMYDFDGVSLDPAEGSMTLNAPDAAGQSRPFRPGARIRVEWYRRTNGARGNRAAGLVRLVEQPVALVPKIEAVTNPLGTFFGADRETPEMAVERMFGPSEGTPVMAADYERLVRQALGNRARGWMVRCWTYAERALVSSAFWPFQEAADDPDVEVEAALADLAAAGPETLLVVVGPTDSVIADEDLDWARRAIVRLVERLARRMPTVRRAVVARFWPLRLAHADGLDVPRLPSWSFTTLPGVLSDPTGRHATSVPKAVVVLNAAVVESAVESTALVDLEVG